MRYVKFTIEENEDFGGNGIVPKIFRNWSNYRPTSDFGLAHDLLEHGTRETGGFDEEMAALGGFLFVRDFGRMQPNPFYSVARNMATGLSQQYSESTVSYIRTAPVAYGLTAKDHADIDALMVNFLCELERDWESENNYYEDEDASCPYLTMGQWSNLIGWVKYGFARAKRRFKGDRGLAFATFQSVERVAKDAIKSLEYHAGSGVEFSLALDYENGWAELNYPARY